MKRIRLGVCMNDEQYEERLGKFLMSHYTEQIELFLYTGKEQIARQEKGKLDAVLLSDQPDLLKFCRELTTLEKTVLFLLTEGSEEVISQEEDTGQKIFFIDKYQNVSQIVDEILKKVGTETEQILANGKMTEKAGICAVYSLCRDEFQLPFALTAASVFGEKRKVLLLDLQENSGSSQLMDRIPETGLEDLIVMTALGRFSGKRVRSCIFHSDLVDVVCPAHNSEDICAAEKGTYISTIRMILQEMDYNLVIVSLGSRFPGFFDFLDQCSLIYFLTERNGPGKWREKEFLTELEIQGYPGLKEKITAIELPAEEEADRTCRGMAERWKWTEPGKRLRKDLQEGGIMPDGNE